MSEFCDMLAELRKDKHLTQKDLAKEMNVSCATISNYETGRHIPDIYALKWFANYFDVTVDYLLGRTDFSLPIDRLNERITDDLTVGKAVELILSLNTDNRNLVCDMLHAISAKNLLENHEKKKK